MDFADVMKLRSWDRKWPRITWVAPCGRKSPNERDARWSKLEKWCQQRIKEEGRCFEDRGRGHELRTRCSPNPGEGKGAASALELLGSKQPYQHLDFSPGRHISNFSKYRPVRQSMCVVLSKCYSSLSIIVNYLLQPQQETNASMHMN